MMYVQKVDFLEELLLVMLELSDHGGKVGDEGRKMDVGGKDYSISPFFGTSCVKQFPKLGCTT